MINLCREPLPLEIRGFARVRGMGMLLIVTLCAAAGCQKSSTAPPVYPVSGSVRWQGQPASQVLVVFHPQSDSSPEGESPLSRSYAKTNANGNFSLTTREPQDGAPAGKYAITLIWPPSESEEVRSLQDKLGGRYANPHQSRLHFEVRPGANTVPTIEIQ